MIPIRTFDTKPAFCSRPMKTSSREQIDRWLPVELGHSFEAPTYSALVWIVL